MEEGEQVLKNCWKLGQERFPCVAICEHFGLTSLTQDPRHPFLILCVEEVLAQEKAQDCREIGVRYARVVVAKLPVDRRESSGKGGRIVARNDTSILALIDLRKYEQRQSETELGVSRGAIDCWTTHNQQRLIQV